MHFCVMCRNIMKHAFDIKIPTNLKSDDAIISAVTKSLQSKTILTNLMDEQSSNSNQSNSEKQSKAKEDDDEEKEDEIDYSNYKGYFGKGRPVTVYAQFIHANKHRYDDDFYEYVTMCARIWKKLPKDQRDIFVDASRRDVIRYRTGKKIPREIKSVKSVTSKIPDGPIKRKITGSTVKEGTPSKKRRLSTPKPKAIAKKTIKKTSTPAKKRPPSPAKKRAPSPAKKKPSSARKRAPSPAKKKPSPAKKRAPSPAKKRAPSPAKKKPSPAKKKPSPKKKKLSPKKKKVISTKAKASSLAKKKSKPKPPQKQKTKMVKKSKSKLKKRKPPQRKSPVALQAKGQSKPTSKPKKSFMSFACISKWWKGKTYDYSSYKPYYGKRGLVGTYAQFIHANRDHSHGDINKPFLSGCSKIWKKLNDEQRTIFRKASDKDFERYRKTDLYRLRVKKKKK